MFPRKTPTPSILVRKQFQPNTDRRVTGETVLYRISILEYRREGQGIYEGYLYSEGCGF